MIPIYVNDSSWIPGPEDTRPLLFKQEKRTPFNVTYGYESWPVWVGPATGCLKLPMQAWLSTNSLNHNYSKVQLHLLSGLSFAYNNSESNNDTKSDRPLGEHHELWTEKQDCIQWDNCRGAEGVILINGSYGIVWDWSSKGYAVSNCSHQISPAVLTNGCVGMCIKSLTILISPLIQIIQLYGMVGACHPPSHNWIKKEGKQRFGD